MPIIYRCDRCGKTFKPEPQNPPFMPNLINRVRKYVIIRTDGNSDFAVCPNCLGELEEWFDKKPVPKESLVTSLSGYSLSNTTQCAACDDYIKGVDAKNECKNS